MKQLNVACAIALLQRSLAHNQGRNSTTTTMIGPSAYLNCTLCKMNELAYLILARDPQKRVTCACVCVCVGTRARVHACMRA